MYCARLAFRLPMQPPRLRFSIGRFTTEYDVDEAAQHVGEAYQMPYCVWRMTTPMKICCCGPPMKEPLDQSRL